MYIRVVFSRDADAGNFPSLEKAQKRTGTEWSSEIEVNDQKKLEKEAFHRDSA